MTALIAAITASPYPQLVSALVREVNTENLANQPPSGGTPASEARKIVIIIARAGEVLNRPL